MAEQESLAPAMFLEYGDLEAVQAIIESVQDGVYIADYNGNYVTANEAFERVTGINRRDLVGRHTTFMLEKKWITQAVNLEVLRDCRSRTRVVRYPSGKDILVTAGIVWNRNRQVIGVVSGLRDLSELNEMQKELSQSHVLIEEYRRKINLLENKIGQNDIGGIARSTETRRVLVRAEKVANSDATVLITGESGVGKEVLAKHIHDKSSRRETGSFVKVDCAALPRNLLESELFGHERGAFTDARKEGKRGLFELADRGTLFLDEIGELPFDLQAKLLSAIQDRRIKRLGGIASIPVDVRIITATNIDLEKMVRERKFREDLYYRINVVPIKIPPLAERKEDIPPLISSFLEHFNKIYKLDKHIAPDVLDYLIDYPWPGNIRELKNTIERLTVMSSQDEITMVDLPEDMRKINKIAGHASLMRVRPARKIGSLKGLMEQYEKELIKEALDLHGNLKGAANDLGVDISTLTRKNRKHGLRKKQDLL